MHIPNKGEKTSFNKVSQGLLSEIVGPYLMILSGRQFCIHLFCSHSTGEVDLPECAPGSCAPFTGS